MLGKTAKINPSGKSLHFDAVKNKLEHNGRNHFAPLFSSVIFFRSQMLYIYIHTFWEKFYILMIRLATVALLAVTQICRNSERTEMKNKTGWPKLRSRLKFPLSVSFSSGQIILSPSLQKTFLNFICFIQCYFWNQKFQKCLTGAAEILDSSSCECIVNRDNRTPAMSTTNAKVFGVSLRRVKNDPTCCRDSSTSATSLSCPSGWYTGITAVMASASPPGLPSVDWLACRSK